MRGPRTSDLTALDKALTPMQQGLDYVPPDIEESLKDRSLDELHHLLKTGCTMASVIMAQKGWVLTMIKRQVGHGNFRDHLADIGFNYQYATKCMKIAYAIARHPALVNITDTHLLRKIAYLPDSAQANIEIEITRVNALDKKKEKHKDLSPWLLELIAGDLKNEGAKKSKKKKNYADVTPSELDSLVAKAQSALLLIYDLKLAPDEYERAARYRNELQLCWDRASYTLRDPEHKTKPIFELDPMADDITEDDDL